MERKYDLFEKVFENTEEEMSFYLEPYRYSYTVDYYFTKPYDNKMPGKYLLGSMAKENIQGFFEYLEKTGKTCFIDDIEAIIIRRLIVNAESKGYDKAKSIYKTEEEEKVEE